MSFFKKALASIGIGGAKVDTVLENPELQPGDTLKGVIKMMGGKVDQPVDRVYLELKTEVRKESDEHEYRNHVVLARLDLEDDFVLKAGEPKDLEFEMEVPPQTPVTFHKSKVWLETGLGIPKAVDPRDRDDLTIQLPDALEVLLEATKILGLEPTECETEYCKHVEPYKFVQEIEFEATRPPFYGRMDDMELVPIGTDDGMLLYLEVDRRSSGYRGYLEEMFDGDEAKRAVTIPDSAIEEGAEAVAELLRETIESALD